MHQARATTYCPTPFRTCVQMSERLTIVMGWSMNEKPRESPDSKAIVRMPSAAPTMDPNIASRLLWKADPMLLLDVTTAARSSERALQKWSSS